LASEQNEVGITVCLWSLTGS